MNNKWTVLSVLFSVAAVVAALTERRRSLDTAGRANAAEAEIARQTAERLEAEESSRGVVRSLVDRIAILESQLSRIGEICGSGNVPTMTPGGEPDARRSEDELIASRLYETAKTKMQASEFQAALDDLECARNLDPDSAKIRDLFDEVSRIMSRRPAEWQDVSMSSKERLARRIEQTRVDVEARMQEGERLLTAGEPARAAVEFDAVVRNLRLIPYDIGMGDTLNLAKERLSQVYPLGNGLGAADFSDGTASGMIVDPPPPVGGITDTIGEVGVFTREHYGGPTDFYDIGIRSTYPVTPPLVTNIPDFRTGTTLIDRATSLNQGVTYVAPSGQVMESQAGEDPLNQGVMYVEPATYSTPN